MITVLKIKKLLNFEVIFFPFNTEKNSNFISYVLHVSRVFHDFIHDARLPKLT